MLLWTFVGEFLGGHMLSFLVNIYLEVEVLDLMAPYGNYIYPLRKC